MQASLQIDIQAEPQEVFRYITDTERLAQWHSLISRARQMDSGALDTGTRFEIIMDVSERFPQARTVLGAVVIKMEGEVTSYKPDAHLRINGESDYNTFEMAFTCEPQDKYTRLTQTTTMNFKNPLMNAAAPIVEGFLKQQARHDLKRLKAMVEGRLET